MNLANALLDLAGGNTCVVCRRRAAVLCPECGGALRPAPELGPIPRVSRALAAFEYEGPARALVLALKLSGRRDAAEPLVAGMMEAIVRRGLRGSALTWVPGRPADARARGFDHAELLARRLAGSTGLSAAGILVRLRTPPDQTLLGAAERRMNLAGAFAALPAPERVVLVDDLVTTGATASACAEALRAAGAREVELIAACRAP